ncbi:Protein of unknown function [Roseateles sp. YR242]|uniref:DUF1631 family protein n=1 Tax=Roseateles sp. YR242 TaxID=1855305 RepID=UPI0008D5184C|nr:DUF1631 family protein [Roseateles sp. YR242]SEL82952.1 Protein of unknown function [Roseateles sp. YR242]
MDAVPLPSDWIEACRPDLVVAAAEWVSATGAALDRAQNRADSVGEANRLFHVQRALDRWQHSAPDRIVGLLLSSMDERCTEPRYAASQPPLLPSEMELVDDDVVSESIGISRLVTGIFAEAEWEIRTVERALSGSAGDFSVRSNPFHPEAIARTVWKLAEDLGLQREERAACLRVSLEATTAFAKTAYANLSAWLHTQTAAEPLSIKRQASAVYNAIPVDVLAGQGDEPLALELEPMHGRPFEAGGAPRAGSPKADGEVVFSRLIRSIEDILADVRLTHELRRVLSGLHMGVLRFAFGTPSALYSAQHGMWDISGALVQYALNHCIKDRVAHDDFVLFADHTIQGLLQMEVGRLHELEKKLTRIQRYLKERPAELVESRRHASLQFARLEERRHKIRSVSINRHRERINAAIAPMEIPFRLRQFLLVDWSEALTHTEAAEGAKSPAYAELWGAVDRMVKAVQKDTLTADPASLQEKVELLKILERGIGCVAVPSVEKYELTEILDRTGMISREGEEWSDSDVGGLDSALPPPPPAPARHRKDFWGGQAAGTQWSNTVSTTVGFTTAMPTSDAEHCVNTLQEDDLIELFLAGTWVEVRLIELAEDGQIFLFEGETDGGGTHQLTRRALLRLFREGLATPI